MQLGIRQRNGGATDAQKAEALVLLLAAGGTCLRDINKLRADKGLERLLGGDKGLERLLGAPLPSEPVLWAYLNAFHDDALFEEVKRKLQRDKLGYIPGENHALSGLGRVNVALAHAVATKNRIASATLDHDATVIESHKQDAKAHDKGGRGVQPSVL